MIWPGVALRLNCPVPTNVPGALESHAAFDRRSTSVQGGVELFLLIEVESEDGV